MSHLVSNPIIYVVATPIGNLDDMTLRAVKILQNVDWIAAEDTRRTHHLLKHFGILGKNLYSYYDEVEQKKADAFCNRLMEKVQSMALVTDAGTPCISDPGHRLIRAAHERGIRVSPIPGADAVTSLVSVSGLPCHRFTFVGFLPTRLGGLKAEISSWRKAGGSVVFYESPRRLAKNLPVIAEFYPNATLAIGREMTQVYEEVLKKPLADAIAWAQSFSCLKGELVVMIDLGQEGCTKEQESWQTDLEEDLSQGVPIKALVKKYTNSGMSRNELYQIILDKKKRQEND